MTIESGEDVVLFVDNNIDFRGVYETAAEFAEIKRFELCDDVEYAIQAIEERAEVGSVSAVFTDGLYGGWRAIIAAARAKSIPGFVVSADPDLREKVERAGANFIHKVNLSPGFVGEALERINQETETKEDRLPPHEFSEAGLKRLISNTSSNSARSEQLSAEVSLSDNDGPENVHKMARANQLVEDASFVIKILNELVPRTDGNSWSSEISRQIEKLKDQPKQNN
ncbi:MAG TPA: hypothetical protein VLF79_02585 [Candidatus Saccharimonadales bacterium]|nr:hypothetical protein [Candidatus Saccharimonadales bacterium]